MILKDEEDTSYKIEWQYPGTEWYVYMRHRTKERAQEHVNDMQRLPEHARKVWRIIKHTRINKEEVI